MVRAQSISCCLVGMEGRLDIVDAQKLLDETPKLNSLCTITSTRVRNESWLIVKNPMTAQHVRVHQQLWRTILQLDGKCTIRHWIERNSLNFDKQHLLTVLMQLLNADVVSCGAQYSFEASFAQFSFSRFNPLAMRFALFNPTRFLDAICKLSVCFSTRLWTTLYTFVLFSAVVILFNSWTDIINFWSSFVGSSQVWWILLLYPSTKILHELAHGLSLRRNGGLVPEAGISFLVLFPLPYVDATDAWTLSRKKRMYVTASGMLADIFLASVGLLLWYYLESGALANVAFALVLLGFASVIVFNANPLLKFDGYYLLEDALDSPGLSRRSLAYYRYLFKRFLLNVRNVKPPLVGKGERRWLLLYGLLATLYRFIIVVLISHYLILNFHELGVILSLFAIVPLCVLPIYKFTHFLFISGDFVGGRGKTITIVSTLTLLISAFLVSVPLPSSTRTLGVVWVNQQAEVYAKQSGAIESILIENGQTIQKNQPIVQLNSLKLDNEIVMKRAAVKLAQMEVSRYGQLDPAQARASRIQLELLEAEVKDIEGKLDRLVVRAPATGRIALDNVKTLVGAYIKQGDLLAYIVDNKQRIVRTVVNQAELGVLEKGVIDAHVRFPHTMIESFEAEVTKQVPSGNHQLPSIALANVGFGGVDTEPGQDGHSIRTLEKIFHLELKLLSNRRELQAVPMGTRAYVTLEHAPEPLGVRWLRVSRQLLLKHLSV